MFTRDGMIGFFFGVGAAAVGFYFYRKNQTKVDAFLTGKGIPIPGPTAPPALESASVEELVSQKERLEDLIAEHELAGERS